MAELGTHLSPGAYPSRPVDDQRDPGPAKPGVAFPKTERGVSGPGPTPGVVVVKPETAPFVDAGEVVLQAVQSEDETPSLSDPIEPPSALAPLSDSSTTIVSSRRTLLSRAERSRPI